jgi:uncharacterized membrane protein YkvI
MQKRNNANSQFQGKLKKNYRRLFKKQLEKNFGLPFLVGFLIILSNAGVLLACGYKDIADELGVCAYLLLIIGVLLQVFCFMKYGEEYPSS